jgi:phosphoglycolate phosphatase
VAVLIGDTLHDFEIARMLGDDCILVAEGHQDRTRLLACGVPVVEELSLCLPLII